MQGFYQNTVQLIESIEDCLEKRRILPCLALLYTGIDVAASLERKPGKGTKAAFVRWVDGYLLKARELPCTATELYAARCGILHTFTADSDLSRAGKVRKLAYAWGTGEADDLQSASQILEREDLVAVHIRDLIDAFRQGLTDYLNEITQDLERQKVVERQAGLWFENIDKGIIEELLRVHAQDEPI